MSARREVDVQADSRMGRRGRRRDSISIPRSMEIGRPLTEGRILLDTRTPNAKLRIESRWACFHRTTFCISQWHGGQILP